MIIFSILLVLSAAVPDLARPCYASPIPEIGGRGLQYPQEFPPSLPKGSVCFFAVTYESVYHKNPDRRLKFKAEDIQLHEGRPFECALSTRYLERIKLDRLCVLKANLEEFRDFKKISFVKDGPTATRESMIVSPERSMWIHPKTLLVKKLAWKIECLPQKDVSIEELTIPMDDWKITRNTDSTSSAHSDTGGYRAPLQDLDLDPVGDFSYNVDSHSDPGN
ncbi:hypothetical protein F5879DRAFT_961076 [Lentinula edodes]|uniref:uncharacterized protein n=1 Tax=Lentinula edodes TaxID=5353 RepID=UPI001E8EB433|nr:uncharacterized protein C8R40DRAFT_1073240 [Lentinula edodes]KAH7870526.1 hypothetical protein C8R40DRAFT_1073240 [Lentinula edodes]KAJ3903104.1 hypothetical protein F5879DRAFT_961076 [Lentinula edodes]